MGVAHQKTEKIGQNHSRTLNLRTGFGTSEPKMGKLSRAIIKQSRGTTNLSWPGLLAAYLKHVSGIPIFSPGPSCDKAYKYIFLHWTHTKRGTGKMKMLGQHKNFLTTKISLILGSKIPIFWTQSPGDKLKGGKAVLSSWAYGRGTRTPMSPCCPHSPSETLPWRGG